MKNRFINVKNILISGALMMTVIAGCGKTNDTASTAGAAEEAVAVTEDTDAAENVDATETAEPLPVISGTWQTASIVSEEDGSAYPEYHVQFTDTAIQYGHMKDGEFVPDHSDQIVIYEEVSEGCFKVKAESAKGVQYTYQTSESDKDVLEYYETWNEDEFADKYSGGASLSRT
jgi:hypothetical protein